MLSYALSAASSPGLLLDRIRKAFERAGISEDEVIRSYWRAIDPAFYAHRIGKTAVLQIGALYDPVFPPERQRKLYLAMRRSDVDVRLILLPCGHYSCGLPVFRFILACLMLAFLKTKISTSPITQASP